MMRSFDNCLPGQCYERYVCLQLDTHLSTSSKKIKQT